jgi:hypothetical protein
MMRRLSFGFALFLLLGCNLFANRPESAPTGLAGVQASPSVGQAAAPATEVATAAAAIAPVPATAVQIEGVPYTAYQIPGDPFRFVCQEPCGLDPQYIFMEYDGFRLAHEMLIQLTGIDTLAELQPVDMHLELEDSICNELPVGHAYVYSEAGTAYTCSDGPGYYPTMEEKIRKAAEPESQYFPLHEYMHTIFFGRISGNAGDFQDYKVQSFHDYVVPIPSYAIGILDPVGFCSYRDPNPPGDYGGWLINELCRRNGFSLAYLTQSLIELDGLVQSGGGQVRNDAYGHPVPSVSQYRDILNRLLGSDTTPAFAAACWPPGFFGNSFVLSDECKPPEIVGTATTVR